MQSSLYSLTSRNFELWSFVASLRSTGLFFNLLEYELAIISGIHPYILETNLSVLLLEKAHIFRQIEQ